MIDSERTSIYPVLLPMLILPASACRSIFGQEAELPPAVPVFMPVPFEVHPGDACLVVFADADIDGWLETGEPQESKSARKHSLSDGYAFVGWRAGSGE